MQKVYLQTSLLQATLFFNNAPSPPCYPLKPFMTGVVRGKLIFDTSIAGDNYLANMDNIAVRKAFKTLQWLYGATHRFS